MLPFVATIHPQLAAARNPDTIIVTQVDSRSAPQRLIPCPDGGQPGVEPEFPIQGFEMVSPARRLDSHQRSSTI